MLNFTNFFGMTFANNRTYGVPEFAGTEVNRRSGNLKGLSGYLQAFHKNIHISGWHLWPASPRHDGRSTNNHDTMVVVAQNTCSKVPTLEHFESMKSPHPHGH